MSRREQLPRRLLSQNVAFQRRPRTHLQLIRRVRLPMPKLIIPHTTQISKSRNAYIHTYTDTYICIGRESENLRDCEIRGRGRKASDVSGGVGKQDVEVEVESFSIHFDIFDRFTKQKKKEKKKDENSLN